MNAQERQLVLDRFAASEALLLGKVEAMTPEQWNFCESADRWSAAQIMEHVVRVEQRVVSAIRKNLASGSPPVERPDASERDSELIRMVSNSRERKIVAPEPARPTGKWPERGELMDVFRGTRAETIQFVRETGGNLRGYSFPHIAFGELDCVQWLLVLAGHLERHAHQIEQIHADPKYPKQSMALA